MRTRSEIEDQIRIQVEQVTLGGKPADDIRSADRLLTDLGLDSLDYAAVMLGTERWLGIRIHEEGVDWGSLRTVGELAKFLEGQQ